MVGVYEIPTWDMDISAGVWSVIPFAQLDYDDPYQRRVIEQGLFRLTIRGECMEPEYPDGSTIEFEIVEPAKGAPKPGRDYVWGRSDGRERSNGWRASTRNTTF